MDSITQYVLEHLNNQGLSYTESLNQSNYNAYKTQLLTIITNINDTILKNTGYNLSANLTNNCSPAPGSYGPNPNVKIGYLILQNNTDNGDYVTINIQFSSVFKISTSGGANKKTNRRSKKSKRTKRKNTCKYRMK